MQPLRWERRPDGLRAPALICAFKGWNDAGEAASAAVSFIHDHFESFPVAGIDPEEFYDFTAVRPTVRLTARSGMPYLALELRDRTGAIQARAFRDADLLAGRFERGDVVRVAGRVERFRDELQVEVRGIERAEAADPAEFLPVAYRDVDELDGFLEHLAREVHDPGYRGLLERLLDSYADGLAEDRRLALAHCVLTHHGADAAPGRRFGSPEALALYRLNALDASVKGALEHGLP